MPNLEKILWSHHAIERGAEYGFTVKEIHSGWIRSVEQQLSDKQQQYKFKRYGMRSLRDKWFWDENCQILFTVSISQSGQWFIQTITRGRGNFWK